MNVQGNLRIRNGAATVKKVVRNVSSLNVSGAANFSLTLDQLKNNSVIRVNLNGGNATCSLPALTNLKYDGATSSIQFIPYNGSGDNTLTLTVPLNSTPVSGSESSKLVITEGDDAFLLISEGLYH